MSFVLLSLRKIRVTYVLSALLAVTAGVVTFRETLGRRPRTQSRSFLLRGVPCRLNNLGDVAGRAGDSSQERLELPSGITAGLSQRIWVSFTAANIVPLRVSTMREKSLERRILLSRSFHLSGRLGRPSADSAAAWRQLRTGVRHQ